MRRTLISFFAAIAFVAAASVALKAQSQDAGAAPPSWDNGIGHSSWAIGLESNDRKKLLDLWDSIGEDLKTDGNDLAGTYVKGGDSGYFFRWSIAKGFVVIPYFDQNLITDYGYGKVTFVDDSEVVFTPDKDLEGGRGLDKMPRKWTAILGHFVPVELLGEFGMFRAGLGVYNEFNGNCCDFAPGFLAARIDRPDRPFPTGVPAKYEKFIKQPITGTITFVGKARTVRNWGYQGELHGQWMDKTMLTPVSISVGSLHGVKKNMLLRLEGDPQFERYLQVMGVGRAKARGFVVQELSTGVRKGFYHDYSDDQDKPLPRIRVGLKITSSQASE